MLPLAGIELQPHASVIILTRNGMPLVDLCLRAVLDQVAPWPFEVIVIDSGSTDGTWELAESLPIIRRRISPSEFNHGATRNLGAEMARGQFLVFLVQDAIPRTRDWLQNLVSACTPSNVAGSYSRQIVRPESDPITHYLCRDTTPCDEAAEVKVLPLGKQLQDFHPEDRFQLALFQNNSSCIRRSVWLRYPFAKLPYGEDIEWGKRVIEAGYSIVYEPSSAVYHSHDRSPMYALKRAYADHHQVAELFDYVLLPSPWRASKSILTGVMRAWGYIGQSNYTVGTKFRFILRVPVYIVFLTVGQYVGPRLCHRHTNNDWVFYLDKLLRVGV